MPWTPEDAGKHVKGLTDHQKRIWAAVANSAMERCQEAGAKDCDASAIKQANAACQMSSESLDPAVLYGEIFNSIQETTSPATEADLALDFIPLVEKALKHNGEAQIKIIQPGWGSSGYYGADMLERDGPAVFKAGTKMYWDHPTATEEAERPERSLRDLAAELTTGARWLPNGPQGAGLYADAKVFDHYKPAVEQMAPHIGVSIRAMGQAKTGQAEGRKGPIIERLVGAKSIDFVTQPGAGGQVVQLFESARPALSESEEVQVDEKEATALKESITKMQSDLATLQEALKTATEERDRLRDGQMLQEAKNLVSVHVGAAHLPDITKARLIERLSANPPTKDGVLDRDALKTAVEAAVKDETDYLTQVTGSPIRGMGGSSDVNENERDEGTYKRLESSFMRMGLSESAARAAAAGRN